MEKVLCRGTKRGQVEKCNEVIFLTDGQTVVIVAPTSRIVKLETDPLRIKCKRCGYRTKLNYKDRKH